MGRNVEVDGGVDVHELIGREPIAEASLFDCEYARVERRSIVFRQDDTSQTGVAAPALTDGNTRYQHKQEEIRLDKVDWLS